MAAHSTPLQPAIGLDWSRLDSHYDTQPMRVEETETDGCLIIRAELPGIDCRRELDVRIRNHLLEIRAERTPPGPAARARSEFHYGRFWRVLSLPSGARESEAAATYKDGVVEVRVPLEDGEVSDSTRIVVEPA